MLDRDSANLARLQAELRLPVHNHILVLEIFDAGHRELVPFQHYVEIEPVAPDTRPSLYLEDVHRANFIAIIAPSTPPAFSINNSSDVRVLISPRRARLHHRVNQSSTISSERRCTSAHKPITRPYIQMYSHEVDRPHFSCTSVEQQNVS